MKFNYLPSLPFSKSSISEFFQATHRTFVEIFPGWSIQSTRQKIIASYWLNVLIDHFVKLMLGAAVLVSIFTRIDLSIILTAIFPTSLIVFACLSLTMYLPHYHIEFLPSLDTCVEVYKGGQLEGIQECKKQQYSVLSLMLIQYILMEMAGMEKPLINTASAQLLARQYGVSVKSVSPALHVILLGEWNRKSVRKRTELLDDFETAKEYFRQLSETRAIGLLEKLQHKILQ